MDASSISRSDFLLFAILSAVLLVACAPKPDPEPVWRFQPGSIQIRYSADAMLNRYNGSAHTLVMMVYQLENREVFIDLAKNEDGLRKLLEGKRFDPGVAGLDRIIVQPGEKGLVSLDRAEGARWVGIALGYYALDPNQATRVFGIPHIIDTVGMIRKKKEAAVKPLTIDINLGPGAIHTIGAHP